ncbi:phage tail assembly protein [Providencia stuartii]|uniref:phage tail assembly protein n=1 Tax=Providencia stuartii TaxID=588 RepID=UPI0025AAB3E9|nr:phage tail assembly protein [Providencia stuartii]MDN0007485.1 phage tail assembly protein [Providencia stuartii]
MQFTLTHGLPYGKDEEMELQVDVELRELTAGDLIDAEAASERVVMTEKGATLLSSPSRMGYELIRRTIVRIGKINGPLPFEMLKKLHQDDLELIAGYSGVQQSAAIATAEAVADKGR